MIEDANDFPAGVNLVADICIIGAGAAGIAMALALNDRNLRVILLESGSLRFDRRTQALYEGSVTNPRHHSPPDKYRQRRFGGSTTIWGGRCMPLDPIDFEVRDFVPDSGWPIAFEDISPYYPTANTILEAGEYAYDASTACGGAIKPIFGGLVGSPLSTDGLERFSCPTNLASRYYDRIRKMKDVRVLLNANCTKISLTANGTSVKELIVSTLQRKSFTVTTSEVVIAVGGLETARLLLSNREYSANGIGNEHDVVGRYYMCHLAGNVGEMQFAGSPADVSHGYHLSPEGVYCRRRISLADSMQREMRIGNTIARLHFPNVADPSHGIGVLSGLYLAKHFISYEYGKRLEDAGQQSAGRYLRHVFNVLTDPIDTAGFLTHWIRKRTLSERKFPSVILKNRTNRFSLDVHAEQRPLRDSRVTLSDERDELGIPRLKIDWKYSQWDIYSVNQFLNLIKHEFTRCGIGAYDYNPDDLEMYLTRYGAYGGHHIGTARMGNDARTSVVDANCKVHRINNLYVAGSATFPTSGQANPTLSVVAFALRLSHHLIDKLRVESGLNELINAKGGE